MAAVGWCGRRWWSPPCIGSDSAPGSGMVFHMHLLIWSRPTLMNIYFPSSVDEELEGGEGCHLPKVTPLTDSNPELQTRLWLLHDTLTEKSIHKEGKLLFPLRGSMSRCQAGTSWLTPHLALVFPDDADHRWYPPPAGSQHSAWVNSVGFQSCRSKEYESSVRLGPFRCPGIENDFYFFPASFWLWLLNESE